MTRDPNTTETATAPSPNDRVASASMRRRWLFLLIACGGPVVLGSAIIVSILIVQERLVIDPETGWIRIQSPPIYMQEPGHELSGHRFLYDPLLGWRNIPNWRATTFGHKLTINSRGLRGREYPYEKPPGVSRILVLGDSYTWGYGVADDEVFTAVLESRLLEADGEWEVLNTGVSGWGTDQEYLYLIHEGFRYSPDIVVLAVFLVNDPWDAAKSRQYGLDKPVFLNTDLELANVPVPPPSQKGIVITTKADPLELTIAIISRIAEACSERGCRLVVIKFGRFAHPDNQRYLPWDTLFESLINERLTVPYLNLDDQFDARSIPPETLGERKPLEGHDGIHWNAFGHHVAAEVLHQFLRDAGLLATGRDGVLPLPIAKERPTHD